MLNTTLINLAHIFADPVMQATFKFGDIMSWFVYELMGHRFC